MKLTKKLLNVNLYSVDMVRLRVRVKSELVQEFFNSFCENPDVEYYETSNSKKFRYNWIFSYIDEIFRRSVSFWVGYQHNMETKDRKYWLVIEYNPNKHDISTNYINQILRYFFNNHNDVQVQSVDLACDMPVNICNIFCDKGGKKVKKLFDYGSDNKTVYIGEGSGRIKIYNKANELKKDGIDLGHDLTRYEISIKFDNTGAFPNTVVRYEGIDKYLMDLMLVPIYCIDSYQFDMGLNETDRAILYAVLNGYPIEALSRRKKSVIEKILSESAGNTLESIGFANAYSDYFKKHISIIQ